MFTSLLLKALQPPLRYTLRIYAKPFAEVLLDKGHTIMDCRAFTAVYLVEGSLVPLLRQQVALDLGEIGRVIMLIRCMSWTEAMSDIIEGSRMEHRD